MTYHVVSCFRNFVFELEAWHLSATEESTCFSFYNNLKFLHIYYRENVRRVSFYRNFFDFIAVLQNKQSAVGSVVLSPGEVGVIIKTMNVWHSSR